MTSAEVVLHRAFESPLLSADEERDLIERYWRGDMAAKDRLIEANVRLALTCAKQFYGAPLSEEDMFQEAVIGLIRAVELYRPMICRRQCTAFKEGRACAHQKMRIKFSTYASRWMVQACQRALDRTGYAIKPPHNAIDLMRAVAERLDAGAESIEEAAAEVAAARTTDANPLSTKRVLAATRVPYTAGSINVEWADHAGWLSDGGCEQPSELPGLLWVEGTPREGIREFVEEALARLTPEQATVIKLRFGWDEEPVQHYTGRWVIKSASYVDCAKALYGDASSKHLKMVQNLETEALDILVRELAILRPGGEARA